MNEMLYKAFSPNWLYKVIFVTYFQRLTILQTEDIKVMRSTDPQNVRAKLKSL